jgi:hypothetical protein
MEVTGQLHDLAALSPGTEPWYPLKNRKLDGTQSRSALSGEEKISAPARYQTLILSSSSPQSGQSLTDHSGSNFI